MGNVRGRSTVSSSSTVKCTVAPGLIYSVSVCCIPPNCTKYADEAAAGISFALMALGGGYIITLSGFRDLFLLGALLTGLGTFLFWLHLRSVNVRSTAKLGSLP